MPRQYKAKEGAKKRTPIDAQKLKEAVFHVINDGGSLKGTAKRYEINVMTLKRYVRAQRESNSEIDFASNYSKSQFFSNMEEKLLEDYLKISSKLHHGLTSKQMRQLAYEFAVRNNKNIPTNWHTRREASYDWQFNFMKRNHSLSLRSPEGTSLTRGTSFNQHNVSQFFDNLKMVIQKYNVGPDELWNIDETGLSNVHKPKKIIAIRGEKQVGKITSGERGETVTACCAINAIGNHIPPFLIFPRKLWQDRMIDNGPPGTVGVVHESGWMNSENFIKFLEHFQKHVKASVSKKCVIIMDNHDSHISLQAITYAKDNGIILLTIPPHTSHRLQPLDRTVYGPLKHFYNTACDDWMISHPGRPMTIYEVAGCLAQAFPLAFTPRNIESGFKSTGIWPVNSNIFTQEDFLSAYVTDRENPSVQVENNTNIEVPDEQRENILQPENVSEMALPSTSEMVPTTSQSGSVIHTPEDIRPYPKAPPRKNSGRGRKRARTTILTETPEKMAIESEQKAKELKRLEKERKAEIRKAKQLMKTRLNLRELSSSVEDVVPLSPESTYNVSDENSENSTDESETDENFDIVEKDWIIVNFVSERNKLHRYVGQVEKETKTGYLVKFARKRDDEKTFKWPEKEDVGVVKRYQIIKKLPNPTFKSSSKRVGSFVFPKRLRKFNVD